MKDVQPTTFKVFFKEFRSVREWVTANGMQDTCVWSSSTQSYTFGKPEDAAAFALRFGKVPYITTLDQMIKEALELNEEDTD